VDEGLIERIIKPIIDNPKSYLTLIYLFRDSFRNRKLPIYKGRIRQLKMKKLDQRYGYANQVWIYDLRRNAVLWRR